MSGTEIESASHPHLAAAQAAAARGDNAESERVLRALHERIVRLDPRHYLVGVCLGGIAEAAMAQRRYDDAETLFLRSLAALRVAPGPRHPAYAAALLSLAKLYAVVLGKDAEAERLLTEALAINEAALGTEHPELARVLTDLGQVFHHQGRYAEARPLLEPPWP